MGETYYLDTPAAGLGSTQAEKNTCGNMVLRLFPITCLVLKANEKELDDKMFSPSHREGGTRVLLRSGVSGSRTVWCESCRQRSKGFRVREFIAALTAKQQSRIIILGHLHPQIGTSWTNAPPTSWVAVQVGNACCVFWACPARISVSVQLFSQDCP